MTPRHFQPTFRDVERAKRRAQSQADRDSAPFAVVETDDGLEIRPLRRARHWCEQDCDAEIMFRAYPGSGEAA